MTKGTCKLCNEERELCKSHIIPEFFYKPLYDPEDKNRIYGFNTVTSDVKVIQKGIREPLFCKDCEGVFQKYEDYVAPLYASDFWTQGKPLRYVDGGECSEAVILKDVDYTKFKLLFLSIFWRLSLDTKYFQKIQLGPYQEVLKKMILESDAGSERRHGIIIAQIILNGKHVPGWVSTSMGGHMGSSFRVHMVILGGYAVYLVLGKPEIPDNLIGCMTREQGSQVIATFQAEHMSSLHDIPHMIKNARTPFWGDPNKSR